MWRIPANVAGTFKIQNYIRTDAVIVSAAIGFGIFFIWSRRNRRKNLGKKAPTERVDRNLSTDGYKLMPDALAAQLSKTTSTTAMSRETCADRYTLHQQYIENVVMPVLDSQTDKKVIGLSCDWVINDFAKPITPVAARLHVCTYNNFNTIFEFCCKDHVPPMVRKLLEDPSVIKVGIDLLLLAKELDERYGLHIVNTLDLRFLSCFNNLLTEDGNDVAACVDANVLAILLNGTGDKEYQAKDAREAIAVFTKMWKDADTNCGPMYDTIKRFFDRQFGLVVEGEKNEAGEACGDPSSNSDKDRGDTLLATGLPKNSDNELGLVKELIELD